MNVEAINQNRGQHNGKGGEKGSQTQSVEGNLKQEHSFCHVIKCRRA